VDDIHIRRLGRAGHIISMVDERISKKSLLGNFITQDQWENQEQVEMTSSGQTRHRSYWIWGWRRRPGPRRGCRPSDWWIF